MFCDVSNYVSHKRIGLFEELRFVNQIGVLGGEVAALEHFAAVEYVRKFLDSETGSVLLVIDLPKSRWSAAIHLIVTVMKRQHTETAAGQNIAAQNSVTAANQQIQIQRLTASMSLSENR